MNGFPTFHGNNTEREYVVSIEESLLYIQKKWPHIVALNIMLDGWPFIHKQFHSIPDTNIKNKDFSVRIGKILLTCHIQYCYDSWDEMKIPAGSEVEEDFIHTLSPLVAMLYSQYREERVMTTIKQIHHDLKNKVSCIIGSLQCLEMKMWNERFHISDWIPRLMSSARSTNTIITTIPSKVRDALNATRSIKKESKELFPFLDDLLVRFADNPELNISVSASISDKKQAMFDEVGIWRVVDNLIQNAIRYKKETQQKAKLQIFIWSTWDGEITLSFRDEWKGMTTKDMQTYLSSHKQTGHYERGWDLAHMDSQGVWASSIMQILEDHGWGMRIESEFWHFSRFIITIPFIDCV